MRRARQQHLHERRYRLAQAAARLMAEAGISDYQYARYKAAHQLGIRDQALWPGQDDIQDALRTYQRLFQSQQQSCALRQRQEAALQAMVFFADFEPRLVGAVLDGTADVHSPVRLHLHADDADAVTRYLIESGIPATAKTRIVHLHRKRRLNAPGWEFSAGGLAFDLTVLPQGMIRQAPVSVLDGKPQRRASTAQLRQLLETQAQARQERIDVI